MLDYRTVAPNDIPKMAAIPVVLCETEVDLYWKMALEVAEVIEENNKKGQANLTLQELLAVEEDFAAIT